MCIRDRADPAVARRLFQLIQNAGTAERKPLDYKAFMKR